MYQHGFDADRGREKRGTRSRQSETAHIGSVALLLAIGGACLVLGVLPGKAILAAAPEEAMRALSRIVACMSSASAFIATSGMLVDMMFHRSVFAAMRSRGLFTVGALFAAAALLGVAALLLAAGGGPAFTEDWQLSPIMSIHIDILYIVAAIVSFHHSKLFRRAYYLQWFHDETV